MNSPQTYTVYNYSIPALATLLDIPVKLLIYWDSHAQPSPGFAEDGPKQISETANTRGHRKMGRPLSAGTKATVTQITTEVRRRASQSAQSIKPWMRWAAAA